MKSKLIFAQLFMFGFFLLGCQAEPKLHPAKSPDQNQNAPLAPSMREFQALLDRLLPLAVESSQFYAPENQTQIEGLLARLSQVSKQVSHSPRQPGQDPSVQFISKAFTQEMDRTYESFLNQKKEFARYNLMNMTSFCIECHTRTSTGPSFQGLQFGSSLQSLKGLDRAEVLMATRQFPAALKELEGFIEESLMAQRQELLGLEKAIRYALAITVKYQRDPDRALQLVERLKKNSKLPFFIKQNVSAWEKALSEWKQEKKSSSKVNSTAASALLANARKLIRSSQVTQGQGYDRASDIYLFRALSDLHLILATDLSKEILGEALYLTGLSYEVVKDLSIWTLHENYYEACIRQVSHSKWSELSYQRLEQSIYFGYSGSSGIHVPYDQLKNLEELKALALRPASH